MKKLLVLVFSLAALTMQAQWVNDPTHNTFIANCESYGRDIIMATNEATGDTYMQWTSSGSNGYSPSLQRLTFDGTPQWGDNGIRITGHTFGSSSDGYSMAITADDAVVSCFANYDGQTIAVKINADGTYAWGEQGIELFDGQGSTARASRAPSCWQATTGACGPWVVTTNGSTCNMSKPAARCIPPSPSKPKELLPDTER